MKKITLVTLLLVMLAVLAGCGQKGDLYMPGEDEPSSRHLLDDPDEADKADDADETADEAEHEAKPLDETKSQTDPNQHRAIEDSD